MPGANQRPVPSRNSAWSKLHSLQCPREEPDGREFAALCFRRELHYRRWGLTQHGRTLPTLGANSKNSACLTQPREVCSPAAPAAWHRNETVSVWVFCCCCCFSLAEVFLLCHFVAMHSVTRNCCLPRPCRREVSASSAQASND